MILLFHWFGHIERMDKNFWVSRCRAVEVLGSAGRGSPKKTWEEVIKMDLRERRVSKDLARVDYESMRDGCRRT